MAQALEEEADTEHWKNNNDLIPRTVYSGYTPCVHAPTTMSNQFGVHRDPKNGATPAPTTPTPTPTPSKRPRTPASFKETTLPDASDRHLLELFGELTGPSPRKRQRIAGKDRTLIDITSPPPPPPLFQRTPATTSHMTTTTTAGATAAKQNSTTANQSEWKLEVPESRVFARKTVEHLKGQCPIKVFLIDGDSDAVAVTKTLPVYTMVTNSNWTVNKDGDKKTVKHVLHDVVVVPTGVKPPATNAAKKPQVVPADRIIGNESYVQSEKHTYPCWPVTVVDLVMMIRKRFLSGQNSARFIRSVYGANISGVGRHIWQYPEARQELWGGDDVVEHFFYGQQGTPPVWKATDQECPTIMVFVCEKLPADLDKRVAPATCNVWINPETNFGGQLDIHEVTLRKYLDEYLKKCADYLSGLPDYVRSKIQLEDMINKGLAQNAHILAPPQKIDADEMEGFLTDEEPAEEDTA